MNIRFKDYGAEFDNILVINGSNKSGKTHLLKEIEKGLNGELEDFYVNNNRVFKGDYNTIYIGDYNNFATDFKLTKTNIFKKLIYDDVLNAINSVDMLTKVNTIFDTIDQKINDSIQNNELLSNIKFNINIDSIDKIIEKFTEIYIEEYLLDDKITPRSILRKLLINLSLYQAKKNNLDNVVILIDDIDTSLDEKEIYNLIKQLEKETNIYFILTSSRNIYSYFTNKDNIYKIFNNRLNNITNLEGSIKETIIMNEYIKTSNKDNFESFYEENEYLINEIDINYFKTNVLPTLTYQIGLLYSNEFTNEEFDYIITTSNEVHKLFLKILYKTLTNNIEIL